MEFTSNSINTSTAYGKEEKTDFLEELERERIKLIAEIEKEEAIKGQKRRARKRRLWR